MKLGPRVSLFWAGPDAEVQTWSRTISFPLLCSALLCSDAVVNTLFHPPQWINLQCSARVGKQQSQHPRESQNWVSSSSINIHSISFKFSSISSFKMIGHYHCWLVLRYILGCFLTFLIVTVEYSLGFQIPIQILHCFCPCGQISLFVCLLVLQFNYEKFRIGLCL